MESKKNKKKAGRAKRIICYLTGSIALCIAAFALMPRLIDCGSRLFYNNSEEPNISDDDWGPEIVRRNDNI